MKRLKFNPGANRALIKVAIGSVLAAGYIGTPITLHADEADYLRVLENCTDIQDGPDRLACFDRVVSELRESVAERRTEEFGFSDYELAQRKDRVENAGDETAPVDGGDEAYSAVVIEFARNAIGKRVVILDNGQVWRETNPSTMRGNVRGGSTVTIERSFGGAFRLSVDGKRGFLTIERVR
ncbi:MAG TPA: hypothetical protein DD861_12820 [Erythrobacter sp.]|nr:hypothetical protein [Erythrobacter sp.]